MKLVDNKVEEFIQKPGIDGLFDAVVSAAVICYQTDIEKIKKTPKQFVEDVLLANGHTRPLEFGTVYLKIPSLAKQPFNWYQSRTYYVYEKYPETIWTHHHGLQSDGHWYITTNLRVIMQGWYTSDKEAWEHGYDKNWLQDVYDFWCDPTEFHDKRRTFTMWMSRGCTDDNRTHITLSSICESTRFCNYSKGKFDNELTFIKPYWISDEAIKAWDGTYSEDSYFNQYMDGLTVEEWKRWSCEYQFLLSMQEEEKQYMQLASRDLQPQQLKRLFPLGVKAELRLCGFDDAWQNFFWRRCDSHADPECVIVAEKIKEIYNSNPS